MKKSKHTFTQVTKKFIRRIACVSDLHVGSRYALWCEENGSVPTLKDDLVEVRRSLLTSWKSFIQTCEEFDVDTVLLVGDVLEGQNVKNRGKLLITTDLNEQVGAAQVLLSPLLKGRRSYWVEGSEYHSSTPGHSPEENLCRRMGEEPGCETQWMGVVVNLNVKEFGKIINISHGGSGAFVYRETAMAREIVWAKMAYADDKLPRIDMFVHGHWHWFSYIHEYGVHFLQLPCWKAFEPSPLFVKNYSRFQPDIGGALILFDELGRITVWHFLFPCPKVNFFGHFI